ncbi:MAG: hypothetical protein AAGJ35_01115, partial [Myxococcota bacterium]
KSLQSELDALQREHAESAASLPERQENVRTLRAQITAKEVRLEREKAFQSQVADGCCPFFEAPCKNVQHGQRLEDFLQGSVQAHIVALTQDQQELHVALKQEQEAQHAKRSLDSKATRLQTQKAGLEQQHERMQRNIEALAEKLRVLPSQEQQVTEHKSALEQLRMRYSEQKGAKEELQKLQVIKVQSVEIHEQIASMEAYFEQKQERLRELRDIEDTVRGTEQELEQMGEVESHFHRVKEQHQRALKQQRKMKTLGDQMEQKREEIEPLKRAIEDLPKVDAALEKVGETLERTRASYESVLGSRTLAEQRPQLSEKQAQLEQQLTLHREQWEQLQRNRQERSAGFEFEKVVFLRKEVEELAQQVHHLQGKMQPERQRLDQLGAEIQKLERLVEQEAVLRAQIAEWKEAYECCLTLRKVIEDAGPRLTKALIFSISQEANRIFRQITQRADLFLHWDEEFMAYLEEEGHLRSFGNLSGGEQMAVAMSIRLAMIRELSDVRLAFFDEPTAHMDAERRQGLARMINSVKDFDQLFVISHDDTFESMTDHYIDVGVHQLLESAYRER